jgi:S-adenosylmethionine synthetase
VQVSCAIGVAAHGIFIETYGTSKVNLTDGEIQKKKKPYLICAPL